jgi:AraC-like DNA-binding protein
MDDARHRAAFEEHMVMCIRTTPNRSRSAAHAELLDIDPDQSSVTAIAHRWGFVRTDHFTARYQARFHVMPTVTLHHRAV